MNNKKAKGIFSMAWANFDVWAHSPRTIIMLCFVFSECVMLMKGLERMSRSYYEGATMHLTEMLVYRMAEGCNLAIMSILLLVTVNELPRRIAFQNYSMIRSNKTEWLLGQIGYCCMMVLSTILMVTVFMAICAIPFAEPGSGWSDLQRIENGTGSWGNTVIDTFLLKNFSPVQALLFCMIPLALFWFTMMLFILLCGLYGSSQLGVVLYAFMLVAHVTFLLDNISWLKFPSAFATFNSITAGKDGEEALALCKVFTGYAIVNLTLFLLMKNRIKKSDFDFFSDNKY